MSLPYTATFGYTLNRAVVVVEGVTVALFVAEAPPCS